MLSRLRLCPIHISFFADLPARLLLFVHILTSLLYCLFTSVIQRLLISGLFPQHDCCFTAASSSHRVAVVTAAIERRLLLQLLSLPAFCCYSSFLFLLLLPLFAAAMSTSSSWMDLTGGDLRMPSLLLAGMSALLKCVSGKKQYKQIRSECESIATHIQQSFRKNQELEK